ncbi:vanin-like protein 1 [Bactrocera neohumeralis]|uniref:vanin-like protein 1 n=1 Tax=Bactrocera neohumeralis TaxID=98809 RepID=UPI002164FA8B|nr:vanin-like protein 1 [Bactrocera neohumeralis]
MGIHELRLSCVLLILAIVGPQSGLQHSLPTDPTYNAGVVEFIPPAGEGQPKAKDGLRRVKNIIESNLTSGLDILVFPEYVLNDYSLLTYVPDPALNITPCDVPNYDFILTELSCAARSRQLYLVIHVKEKVYCANDPLPVGHCNVSGINTYSANVVFDRQGRVISRYRKTNLFRYEWYSVNVLPQPQLATFTTDFGVTFGHFIGSDFLFWQPAQRLVAELGITDIIYATHWFNELPFLTAVQLQEGWSYANDVNLLAADASEPSGQISGSGIYAGRLGRLKAVIYEEPTTQLLTASVPKHAYRQSYQAPPLPQSDFVPQVTTPRLTKLDLQRDYNVDIFKTQLLDAEFTAVNATLCYDNQFCCHFEATRIPISSSRVYAAYRYRLAAYSGSQATVQRLETAALKVCAVFACTSAELHSCGRIFPAGVTVGNAHYFSALNVRASFPQAARRLIMPSSVDGSMLPLPVHMYKWQEVERHNLTDVTIRLLTPKLDLLTFGIWSNYFLDKVSQHNLDPILLSAQQSSGAATAEANMEL